MATVLALEAQRIMTLSLNKIVSSRGKKGGVNLHRNLLIAGVLFKARDTFVAETNRAQLAAQTQTAVAEVKVAEPLPPVQQPETPEQCRIITETAEVKSPSPQPDVGSSFAAEFASSETDYKENVPPTTTTGNDVTSADSERRAAAKRRHSATADDCGELCAQPACKLSRTEPEVDTTKHVADDAEAEMETDVATAPPVVMSSCRFQSVVVREQSSAKRRAQRVSLVVCLPRVEVSTTTSCLPLRAVDSLVRTPIFIAQSV